MDYLEIPSVYIDDLNNPNGRRSWAKDVGSVDYGYYIGKYEVTNEEYTVLLNAVASNSNDPRGLWNQNMNILRGEQGNWIYNSIEGKTILLHG